MIMQLDSPLKIAKAWMKSEKYLINYLLMMS